MIIGRKLEWVKFINQYTAEKMSDKHDIGMISITGKGEADLKDWGAVLRLQFSDIDTDFYEGSVIGGEKLTLFKKRQAEQIINFIKENRKFLRGIFVHCMAGISRSAAVAKFIAEMENLPFNHQYQLYNKYVYRTLTNTYWEKYYGD